MLTIQIIQTVLLGMILMTMSAVYGEIRLQHEVINKTYTDMLRNGATE